MDRFYLSDGGSCVFVCPVHQSPITHPNVPQPTHHIYLVKPACAHASVREKEQEETKIQFANFSHDKLLWQPASVSVIVHLLPAGFNEKISRRCCGKTPGTPWKEVELKRVGVVMPAPC